MTRLEPSIATALTLTEPTFQEYETERRAHWDGIALDPGRPSAGSYYHRRITEIYRLLVAPGQRVLEVGCGEGDLLAALEPSEGVGVDFSLVAVSAAKRRHSGLRFVVGDAHLLPVKGKFDVIILSDLINDLWDVLRSLTQLKALSHDKTRIFVNFYNTAWEFPLRVAQRLTLARPLLPQNWLTRHDVRNLLSLAGLEVIREWKDILLPLPIPVVATLFNRYLAKIWPFYTADLTTFAVARGIPLEPPRSAHSVSLIIPARNEAGNIQSLFERVPELGTSTQLLFVEGGSQDATASAIESAIREHPEKNAQIFRQSGRGKGDAVRLGFAEATGDILMILDADMTVAPEELGRFYEAIHSRQGEFINGVRLVYPMEKEAMRLLNVAANRFFSAAFSYLLGQPVRDTLCGTKVLWREDYIKIAADRSYFGEFDPFGDFDLLFGAAKQNLKIVDMPIRYRERSYGSTNIQRWRHGLLLLRMVLFAARRLKFV